MISGQIRFPRRSDVPKRALQDLWASVSIAARRVRHKASTVSYCGYAKPVASSGMRRTAREQWHYMQRISPPRAHARMSASNDRSIPFTMRQPSLWLGLARLAAPRFGTGL